MAERHPQTEAARIFYDPDGFGYHTPDCAITAEDNCTCDIYDRLAAIEVEAQDTAASSGLREALDQHRLSSRGAGLWSCRCGYSGLGYIDHLVAALAHSTPEPSLRGALAAALRRIEGQGCDASRFYGDDPSWDACLDPNNREVAPTGNPDVDRCDPCLAHAALSAQPSEPGETT